MKIPTLNQNSPRTSPTELAYLMKNNVEKEENAEGQHFLLFSHCFHFLPRDIQRFSFARHTSNRLAGNVYILNHFKMVSLCKG